MAGYTGATGLAARAGSCAPPELLAGCCGCTERALRDTNVRLELPLLRFNGTHTIAALHVTFMGPQRCLHDGVRYCDSPVTMLTWHTAYTTTLGAVQGVQGAKHVAPIAGLTAGAWGLTWQGKWQRGTWAWFTVAVEGEMNAGGVCGEGEGRYSSCGVAVAGRGWVARGEVDRLQGGNEGPRGLCQEGNVDDEDVEQGGWGVLRWGIHF